MIGFLYTQIIFIEVVSNAFAQGIGNHVTSLTILNKTFQYTAIAPGMYTTAFAVVLPVKVLAVTVGLLGHEVKPVFNTGCLPSASFIATVVACVVIGVIYQSLFLLRCFYRYFGNAMLFI